MALRSSDILMMTFVCLLLSSVSSAMRENTYEETVDTMLAMVWRIDTNLIEHRFGYPRGNEMGVLSS